MKHEVHKLSLSIMEFDRGESIQVCGSLLECNGERREWVKYMQVHKQAMQRSSIDVLECTREIIATDLMRGFWRERNDGQE